MRVLRVRPVILPPPSEVLRVGMDSWRIILYHTETTLLETLLGFAFGAVGGVLLALMLQLSGVLHPLVAPYLVISQLIPKVALAPLLIIWCGLGIQSKVIVGGLVCFFPTFINTLQGLSASDPDLAILLRSLCAGRLVTLLKLQLPFAVPFLVAGLKASALLSVTGCVIGELVGADRGLGFLLMQSEAQLDTPLLFAALLALVLIGSLVYAVPLALESLVLRRYMPEPRTGQDLSWSPR